MNKKKVCGEFPEFCYKAFTCEEYAKQFMETGIFRMGCIYTYREIEDESRRDPTEGTGQTFEPGLVTESWASTNPKEKIIWTKKWGYRESNIVLGNPVFCFCTSLSEIDLDFMKSRFSRYVVKIEEPRKLAEEIYDYFFDQKQRFLIEGCRVVYNKGQKLHRKLDSNERVDLAYKQKPGSFVDECEFRIVAIKFSGECNSECKFLDGEADLECRFIEVKLGKKLSYLSLV